MGFLYGVSGKTRTENSMGSIIISSLVGPMIVIGLWRLYDSSITNSELLTDKQIDNKLNPIAKEINSKLNALGQRVATIEGKLDMLRIQKLAAEPKKAVNAKQTSEILNAARKNGTKFDAELITDAGKQFISAGVSSSDTLVWEAAQAFLDYRSFLNSALAPATDKFAPIDKEVDLWKFALPHGRMKPGEEFRVKLSTGKSVPAEGPQFRNLLAHA
jgi:hypothetical protein